MLRASQTAIYSCLATINIQVHYIPTTTSFFVFPQNLIALPIWEGVLSAMLFIDYPHLGHKAPSKALPSELLLQL